MSTELDVTFENIRQFLQGGYIPAGPSDFGGLNFREALRGQNRLVYEVRDDAIYIHLIIDMRRDLRTLLRPSHSCW
jgi:toxin ParE1/3/4